MRVGWIGLGVMGGPMVGHMLDADKSVTVWARRRESAEPYLAKGATLAKSPQALAAESDAIVLCVNRSEDVEELVEALNPTAGSLIIDHSTIAPSTAQDTQRALKEKGVGFVDAPLTGGSMGAIKGTLTVFCGGDPQDVEAAFAVIKPYTARSERVGGPGAGQLMKMANQIAVAGSLLGLCEALSFAQKAGLDLTQTKAMVGSGAAGSWAFENYGPKILAKDWSPGFSVINQRKDFAYALEAANELDSAIPGTALVDELLAELQESGRGGETTAALFDVLLRRSSGK